jgi:cell wall assembly regulator SMI1
MSIEEAAKAWLSGEQLNAFKTLAVMAKGLEETSPEKALALYSFLWIQLGANAKAAVDRLRGEGHFPHLDYLAEAFNAFFPDEDKRYLPPPVPEESPELQLENVVRFMNELQAAIDGPAWRQSGDHLANAAAACGDQKAVKAALIRRCREFRPNSRYAREAWPELREFWNDQSDALYAACLNSLISDSELKTLITGIEEPKRVIVPYVVPPLEILEPEQAWAKIRSLLSSLKQPEDKLLGEGCTLEALAELEAVLELKLPESFKLSHTLCCRTGGFPDHRWHFMDPSEIREACEDMDGMEKVWEGTVESEPGVKPVFWTRGWVPVAQDFHGNFIVLDLDPEPEGHHGQVMQWTHEEPYRGPMCKNWEEFLAQIVCDLKGLQSGTRAPFYWDWEDWSR